MKLVRIKAMLLLGKFILKVDQAKDLLKID